MLRHLKQDQTTAWQDAEKDEVLEVFRTWRVWIASSDACEVCLALDETRVRLNEPWPNGLMEAHAHDGCRCSSGLAFDD